MARTSGQRRGVITRHRVIDAAIEAFGMEGFERTSTRALVERAGTNLVSIHYHFGGKEALYRAAAEHIGASIRERNRAVTERGQALAADPATTRAELVDAVCAIYDEFATLVLSGGIPECWRRFIIREQVEPSATGAFEAMFGALRPIFETVFALVARLIALPVEHREVRLLSMMILGQVAVFRTHRTGALQLLGWEQFGPEELREIRTVARTYIARMLGATTAPPAPKMRRPPAAPKRQTPRAPTPTTRPSGAATARAPRRQRS